MLRDSIMACKLYKASNHKESILQALDDNLNVELVRQLSSQLDKDSLPESEAAPASKSQGSPEPAAEDQGAAAPESSGGNSAPSGSGHTNVSINVKPAGFNSPAPEGEAAEPLSESESSAEEHQSSEKSQPEGGEPQTNTAPQGDQESKPAPASNKPKTLENKELGEDKKIVDVPEKPSEPANEEKTPVGSATVLYNSDVRGTQVPELNTEVLKGDLNLSDDTAGVIRIQIKEQELWIYYNDSVNLNDKMEAVIEKLIACTYSYLEFNRLARKNNAIVFDILDHAPRTVETVEDTNESE